MRSFVLPLFAVEKIELIEQEGILSGQSLQKTDCAQQEIIKGSRDCKNVRPQM